MSTTGIARVEGVETPAEGLSKLVVGHVLSCEDVPETLACVRSRYRDTEGPRQIVCGLKCHYWNQRSLLPFLVRCGQLQNQKGRFAAWNLSV